MKMKLKQKETGGKYPTIVGTKQVSDLVDKCRDEHAKLKKLKDDYQMDAAELASMIMAEYYSIAKKDPDTQSVKVLGETGAVMITMCRKLKGEVDPTAVAKVIGAKRFSEWFAHFTQVEVNMDIIPSTQRAKVAGAIATLLKKLGYASAINLSRVLKPTEAFWEGRHNLTIEQNVQLDEALPVVRTMRPT